MLFIAPIFLLADSCEISALKVYDGEVLSPKSVRFRPHLPKVCVTALGGDRRRWSLIVGRGGELG